MVKAGFAVLPLVIASAAYAADPSMTKAPAGLVDKEITCDDAKSYVLNTADNDLTIENYNRNMATFQKCKAAVLNRKAESSGTPARVVASGHMDGESRVMVFGLISVDPKDADGIKQLCNGIAQSVGVVTENPAAMTIISITGEYTCGSYVDAALRSDPILIFAPSLVPGLNITKDVLRSAGVPQNTIDDAEKFIRSAAGDVATTAAQTAVGAATGGVVVIDKELRCATIFGKRVCR